MDATGARKVFGQLKIRFVGGGTPVAGSKSGGKKPLAGWRGYVICWIGAVVGYTE